MFWSKTANGYMNKALIFKEYDDVDSSKMYLGLAKTAYINAIGDCRDTKSMREMVDLIIKAQQEW
jgi:hypothetical protein